MKYLLLAIVLVSGCATPYQRKGFRGGYDVTQIQPNLYLITVAGNGYTAHSTLIKYFHRAASELCGEYEFNMGGSTANQSLTCNKHGCGAITKYDVTGYVSCSKPPISIQTCDASGCHEGRWNQ